AAARRTSCRCRTRLPTAGGPAERIRRSPRLAPGGAAAACGIPLVWHAVCCTDASSVTVATARANQNVKKPFVAFFLQHRFILTRFIGGRQLRGDTRGACEIRQEREEVGRGFRFSDWDTSASSRRPVSRGTGIPSSVST